MATPLSCAGPRRTLPLDSGRAAATCPGRVGTCLPPLLPTPGTCSSLAGWQPSRALPPAGPAAAATRAHLLPSSCLTNNWHLLSFNRFQCVAPKLVILFWSSMVKDAVLCNNPLPDGSAARALAGREPDRPRLPLCQPRCTPTAAARPSNPSPATASRPSRTMPAASLRQWPAHLAVVAPKVSPAALPRGSRRRGKWKGQVAFHAVGHACERGVWGGGSRSGLGSGSARATVLGGGGERHHRN
jgi:hypothetical protein